uniref:Ras-related protein Rab-21 n=1 Tax=Ascaris suum TaxID=6253 RepID=F1L4K2_ASCSU
MGHLFSSLLNAEHTSMLVTFHRMEAAASTSANTSFTFKVVLLGEGAVGKSSLMLRYVENKFNPRHISTIQASFLCKKIVVDGNAVILNIWDTAGQEKFHALGPIYYRDSHGALLIYDITDLHSFEKVKSWVKELRRILGESVVLLIVGNKTDLERNRNVERQTALEYAKSVGADHCETSAKNNVGINEAFELLTKAMIERAKKTQLASTDGACGRAPSRRNNLLIVDDPPTSDKKCCSG